MNVQRHFVNGAWADSRESFSNVNPSDTTQVTGEYALGGRAEVTAAVAAARAAAPEWAASDPQRRFDALASAAREILSRREELGRLLAREEGKTLREAMAEVGRAGRIFEFFAGEALRMTGEHLDSVRPGVEIDVLREPVGVVGVITPWNFPVAIPAWKIAPALAFGNAVVFKPASAAAGSAWALAEILSRVGLPRGVFNLVLGRGPVGEAIVEHRDVHAVTFTGSAAVGTGVAAKCAARLARAQLEMGGKNPLVILDDADLKTAVEAATDGAYFSAGERCTASSRIVVTSVIYDRFRAALADRVGSLRVGHALDPTTEVGPVVDRAHLEKVLHWIEIGRDEGAALAAGGGRAKLEKEGCYLRPTLFAETANSMRINREEIFGPVAAIIRVKDYDEALAVANDTEYGLSTGIVTNSLRHALHFRRHAQAGLVMVNLPTAGVDFHVPFGGRKASNHGPREQGRAAREFFTAMKTCYTKADAAI